MELNRASDRAATTDFVLDFSALELDFERSDAHWQEAWQRVGCHGVGCSDLESKMSSLEPPAKSFFSPVEGRE